MKAVFSHSSWKKINKLLLYLFVCLCVCVCMQHYICSGNNSVKLILFFHLYIHFEDWTQIIRPVQQALYLLSHFAGSTISLLPRTSKAWSSPSNLCWFSGSTQTQITHTSSSVPHKYPHCPSWRPLSASPSSPDVSVKILISSSRFLPKYHHSWKSCMLAYNKQQLLLLSAFVMRPGSGHIRQRMTLLNSSP